MDDSCNPRAQQILTECTTLVYDLPFHAGFRSKQFPLHLFVFSIAAPPNYYGAGSQVVVPCSCLGALFWHHRLFVYFRGRVEDLSHHYRSCHSSRSYICFSVRHRQWEGLSEVGFPGSFMISRDLTSGCVSCKSLVRACTYRRHC